MVSEVIPLDSDKLVPPRAKLVGGAYIPTTEVHLQEWMTTSKRHRWVNGKLTYQYHKLEAAMRHQPADRRRTAIDVGAHVGLWSMWLTEEFDYLKAFEPVPWFQDIFRANVNMDRCMLYGCAVGVAGADITIKVPLKSTGAAHIADRDSVNEKFDPDGPMEMVEGVVLLSLDAFHFSHVDFIKIDVEGFEAEVVRGAERTIKEQRPNIIVEQKGNDTAYGERRDAAKGLLESWGMKPLEVISGDWIMGW